MTFNPSNEPSIWFFVVMDCEHNLHHKFKTMPKLDLEFTVLA